MPNNNKVTEIAHLMEQDELTTDAMEQSEEAEMDREKNRITKQQETTKEITTDLSDETGKIVDMLKRVTSNYPEGKGLDMLIKHFQNQGDSFQEEGEPAHDIIKAAAMTSE